MFNILVFPKWVLDIEFHLSIKIKFFYEGDHLVKTI